jgi:predicted nucleic acid-binding protein
VSGAITNTSPPLYLHRAGALGWLTSLFDSVWVPGTVAAELEEGLRRGYDVPLPDVLPGFEIVEPNHIPSPWLALDLGAGELAAMALALDNPSRVVLLDDQFARRTAQAAGLTVWGTLRIVLEAKDQGLTPRVEPVIDKLRANGMWISDSVRRRILALAGE